jgi:hypothetical protein
MYVYYWLALSTIGLYLQWTPKPMRYAELQTKNVKDTPNCRTFFVPFIFLAPYYSFSSFKWKYKTMNTWILRSTCLGAGHCWCSYNLTCTTAAYWQSTAADGAATTYWTWLSNPTTTKKRRIFLSCQCTFWLC